MTEDERDDLLVSEHIERFNAQVRTAEEQRSERSKIEEPNA